MSETMNESINHKYIFFTIYFLLPLRIRDTVVRVEHFGVLDFVQFILFGGFLFVQRLRLGRKFFPFVAKHPRQFAKGTLGILDRDRLTALCRVDDITADTHLLHLVDHLLTGVVIVVLLLLSRQGSGGLRT